MVCSDVVYVLPVGGVCAVLGCAGDGCVVGAVCCACGLWLVCMVLGLLRGGTVAVAGFGGWMDVQDGFWICLGFGVCEGLLWGSLGFPVVDLMNLRV